MSPAPAHRYLFSGHTVGASAQFHTPGDEKLSHVIPTLGASVLPVTGGLSKGHAADYCYNVDLPSHRTLLSVRKIESMATGREFEDRFETEIETQVHSIHVLEKLHIANVGLHVLSTMIKGEREPRVKTKGNKIEGMMLDKVAATITFDEEPLFACGSKAQLADFYKKQSAAYRREQCWRFDTPPDTDVLHAPHNHYKCSIVKKIELDGPKEDVAKIVIDGYTLHWPGFGRIVLGEVVVKGNDRQVTMVRLAMGAKEHTKAAAETRGATETRSLSFSPPPPPDGSGSIGCGQTNGQVGTS